MKSHLGWVDFSTEEREKMMETIKLFQEQDTRDELGVSTIRDGFSNYFFPGTSTIQTRIHYMLFVPWIYKQLEKYISDPKEFEEKARSREISLMNSLSKTEDTHGLLGKEAGATLRRLPSNVYWAGLWSWGIRKFQGSQADYHRSINLYQKRKKAIPTTDDGEPVEKDLQTNWDPYLPAVPAGFPWQAQFLLNREQAQYLQDCIKLRHPDSLFSYLLDGSEILDVPFFWEEPKVNKIEGVIKEDLKHARFFSETIHGASLLYNYLLARKIDNPDLIDRYEEMLSNWSVMLKNNIVELEEWNFKRSIFWHSNPFKDIRIPPRTRRFVDSWLDIIFEKNNSHAVINCPVARGLIEAREWELKRSRARLHNKKALQTWGGASGIRQHNFRWPVAKQFIYDLLQGLKEG